MFVKSMNFLDPVKMCKCQASALIEAGILVWVGFNVEMFEYWNEVRDVQMSPNSL